jgi:hypothetical protein
MRRLIEVCQQYDRAYVAIEQYHKGADKQERQCQVLKTEIKRGRRADVVL